jgi:prophage regulatory protein
MDTKTQAEVTILRRKQVEARTGLSCSTLYERINPRHRNYDPNFPKPIALGDGKNPPVGWLESEVNAWLLSRIELSRKAA